MLRIATTTLRKPYTMKQYILLSFLLFFIGGLTVSAGNASVPSFLETSVEQESDVKIVVEDNQVHILGAQGAILEIYDVTGKRISAYRIDSNDKTITLNLGKGCYILRVGKTTRKIALS